MSKAAAGIWNNIENEIRQQIIVVENRYRYC